MVSKSFATNSLEQQQEQDYSLSEMKFTSGQQIQEYLERGHCGTLKTLRLDLECTVTIVKDLNRVFERNKSSLQEIHLPSAKGIEHIVELKWDLLGALYHFDMLKNTFSASSFTKLMEMLSESIIELSLYDISVYGSPEDILILPPKIIRVWLYDCHFNAINNMVAQSISKLKELTLLHDCHSHIFTLPAYQPNPKLNFLTVYSDNPIPVEKITNSSSLMILKLSDCDLLRATRQIFDLSFSFNSDLVEVHLRGSRLDKALFTELLIDLLKQEQDIIVEFKEDLRHKKQLFFTFPTKEITIELSSENELLDESIHNTRIAKSFDEESKRENRRNLQFKAQLKVRTEAHEILLRKAIELIDFGLLSISIEYSNTNDSVPQDENEFVSFKREKSFISFEPQLQNIIKESFAVIKFDHKAYLKSFIDSTDEAN